MSLEINLQQAIDNMQEALTNQQNVFESALTALNASNKTSLELKQTNFENSIQANLALITARVNTSFTNVNITANENARLSAETIRLANEIERKANEATRIINENLRISSVNSIKTAYDNATKANLSVEVSDSRTNADGVVYNNLSARLNSSDAQLTKNSNQLEVINLNLSNYGNFKTLADYADITTIVKLALADLANKVKGITGWRLFNVSVLIPGGHWTISEKRVFDLSKYGSIPAIKGFNICGAGYENTEIIFDSNVADTDNYLIYNYDNFGYSEIRNIRFTSKNQVEKFMYNYSAISGNSASFIFKNVALDKFKGGIHYDGNVMCSEVDYYSLKITGTPVGGYGIYVNNPQSLNHNFFACEIESILGVGIEFAKGGCANFFGGSLITSNGGVIFKTSDNTGTGVGTTSNTFNFYGIRTEMYGTGKLFDIASNTELNFDGCNLTVEATGAGNVRGILGLNHSYVTFKNCSNKYKYQVRVDDNSYFNGACKVLFDNCTLFEQLSTLVTTVGTITNFAGYPLIEAIRTRYPFSGAGQRPIVDVSMHKEKTNLAMVTPAKSVFLRVGTDYNSGLPNNAGTSFTLPLHAIITKIRIVHRSSPQYGLTYNYSVKNFDNSVEFVALNSVLDTNVNTVFATSSDLWYEVNSEAKRVINLVQTGGNQLQTGYIVVDYI